MKITLVDIEEPTLSLLDHLPEHATADQLIFDFTKIQDEFDDMTEKFFSMVHSVTANRPAETCNNRNEVNLQQRTDPIIAATSGDTLASDSPNATSIQNAPTNTSRPSSADVHP